MSETEQNDLLEVLEAVYWDTVIPIASDLRDAGVDLLDLEIDREATTYWEPHPPYAPLESQR
jgi:hypothetical protein